MINREILLKKGYKEYNNVPFDTATRLFQKRILDNDGDTQYFINIYEYSSTKATAYEVQLHFCKEKYYINITLFDLDKDLALDEIEKEVHTIWHSLHCEYYEKIEKLDFGEEI